VDENEATTYRGQQPNVRGLEAVSSGEDRLTPSDIFTTFSNMSTAALCSSDLNFTPYFLGIFHTHDHIRARRDGRARHDLDRRTSLYPLGGQ
jgi:hypothetical protein